MSWINDIVCENAMKGWCDELGRNPKNYLFTFILTIFMNYGFPLILAGIIAMFFGHAYFTSTYLDMLSPVLSGISLLYGGYTIIGGLVLGITCAIIGMGYLLYMIRQLGIFALIPVIIEITKTLIVIFFKESWIIGIIISIIPWMTIAVGSHFISYNIGKGLIVKILTGE